MAAGGDAGGAMYVRSDVALLRQMRGAGMDAHPHADRPEGQSLERLRRGGERSRSSREGDEEGVSLRIDLDAAVGLKRAAQDAAMLGEPFGVLLGPELVQQL